VRGGVLCVCDRELVCVLVHMYIHIYVYIYDGYVMHEREDGGLFCTNEPCHTYE